MTVVGLTGGVASGKSAVAELWRRWGARISSADDWAKRATQPKGPTMEKIAAAFGPDFIRPGGALDRPKMRELVFSDSDARRRLESIIHPEVARLRAKWLARERLRGARIVICEIPLLFEAGLRDEVDIVVLVEAPEALRMKRLERSRGLSARASRAIMAAQRSTEETRALADIRIVNDGGMERLERRARRAFRELRARCKRKGE